MLQDWATIIFANKLRKDHLLVNGNYDLTLALASLKPNDVRYGKLVRPLRNLQAARAILTDLSEAKEAIETGAVLADLPEDRLDEHMFTRLGEGLFYNALMLYCRATHSATNARHRIDLVQHLSAEQKQAHKELCKLRDQVIAHYGPGEDLPGGAWIKDHVVLRINRFGPSLSFPQMRAGFKGLMNRKLDDLIQISIKHIDQTSKRWGEEIFAALATGIIDEHLSKVISKFEFDEVSFFGRPKPPSQEKGIFWLEAGAPLDAPHVTGRARP